MSLSVRMLAGRLPGAASLALPLALTAMIAPPLARAIPEAAALAKLSVIPVFVITDAKGVPLPIPRQKTLVLPLFLEKARADAEVTRIIKENKGFQPRVVALPMNEATQRMTALRKDLKPGYTLVSPVVPRRGDLEQATKLLRGQGVEEQQIRKGLNVPVFFTKPFLTLKTPEGERGVFFLSYADLQSALGRTPNKASLKPQAADITAVLREIINSPKDSFIFYPTQEYFSIVQQQRKGAPAGGAAARRGGSVAPGLTPPPAPPKP